MDTKLRDLYNRVRCDDPSLTMLNLNSACIGNRGAKALGAALHFNSHLVVLFLDNNGVAGSGCQALAAGMARHPALEFVFLGYNSVGNTGAAALALALKENRKIQVLKLMHCNITAEGSVALAQGLRCNSSLQKLNLDGNRIGDKGALALAASLQDNHALTHLDIRYAGIHELPRVGSSFSSVLHSDNKTLQELLLAEDLLAEDDNDNDSVKDDLQLYLHLNRLGRHSFGTCTVLPASWTRVLAAASLSPRLLHAVLVARPDLLVLVAPSAPTPTCTTHAS
jgi:Ran GTPase-activating protein (RanGAP) involved in mRNA processing and transport